MNNHLTRTDRALIEKYLAQGYNLSEILLEEFAAEMAFTVILNVMLSLIIL